MEKLKYVIFDSLFPVIFSPAITHRDIHPRGRATSAGFVSLIPIKRDGQGYINATVYGESISLGLASNGVEDETIIERSINQNYDR